MLVADLALCPARIFCCHFPWSCICSFVSYRYHWLLVQKYRCKRGKAAATKGQAAREGRSVWETERIMDVELFLEGQTRWEEESPHCLAMLYEKFKHAADEGQNEVEWIVCWGHCQGLPKLNPEADVSTIELVGLQMTREEIESLYLEVYKMQRLPGSPPGEPELMQVVVSSFKECQGQKKERMSDATLRSQLTDAQPNRSGTPGREGSVERSLATMQEAHQKALATPAALEGEIKRLSHPLPQSQPKIRARSKTRDCQRWRTVEWKRRHHQVCFKDCPTPYHLARKSHESIGKAAAPEGLDLEEPPELEPEVACFLWESTGNCEEEDEKVPLEPLIREFCQWVPWKANTCEMPDWWGEVVAVPEVEDHKKLAREVRALFQYPRRMKELHPKENDH